MIRILFTEKNEKSMVAIISASRSFRIIADLIRSGKHPPYTGVACEGVSASGGVVGMCALIPFQIKLSSLSGAGMKKSKRVRVDIILA